MPVFKNTKKRHNLLRCNITFYFQRSMCVNVSIGAAAPHLQPWCCFYCPGGGAVFKTLERQLFSTCDDYDYDYDYDEEEKDEE